MFTRLQKYLLKIKLPDFFLLFVLIIGSVLVFIGGYFNYQRRVLSFAYTPKAKIIETKSAKPRRIVIENLGIDVAVENSQIIDGIWEISETNASFLITSAEPGTVGNVVIYGHNRQNIFGKLVNRVKSGQHIKLVTEDGQEYFYQVDQVVVVKPNEVGVVLPTKYEVLTVYTCTGFFDSQRLVVRARPI